MESIKDSLRLLAVVSFASALSAVSFSLPSLHPAVQASTVQDSKPQQGGGSIVIHLEQKRAEKIQAVRADHVFDPGDVVRFRITSGFDGYLYVVDQGSSGTFTALFPAAGTTRDNVIRKATNVLVPSVEDGWFQVEGPPGFDVVYFLVSSTPLDLTAETGSNGKSTPSPAVPPTSLKPRCNDAIFQARGECIDDSAGPAPLARDVPLPPQISMAVPNISRDIVFATDEDDNSVKATAASDAPVAYIFRLAHH
jgi:hypothetical protein